MAASSDVISVLVALEFVSMAAIVVLLGPLDAVIWVVPLMAVLSIALVMYWR